MKKLLGFLLALVAVLGAAFFFLRTPDTDPQAMLSKYGGDDATFAQGDGVRLHYRDQGNPEGPAIVLLHGNSASLQTWEPLVALLGEDYRIITYDHPGHGLTGPSISEDYSAGGMMKALDVIAAETGVDHFVLGGNSMGGWIAWRYALEHPDRVDALILLDASGMPLLPGETEPPLNIGFKLLRMKWLRPVISQITPRSIVEKSLIDTIEDDALVTDEMIDRYWELLRYPGNRRAAALRTDIDREGAMADRVSEITAPTLILWGRNDHLIYATAAGTFDERIPHSSAIVYENVGHIPMEEVPDRVASDIREFLAGLNLRGANEPAMEAAQ